MCLCLCQQRVKGLGIFAAKGKRVQGGRNHIETLKSPAAILEDPRGVQATKPNEILAREQLIAKQFFLCVGWERFIAQSWGLPEM